MLNSSKLQSQFGRDLVLDVRLWAFLSCLALEASFLSTVSDGLGPEPHFEPVHRGIETPGSSDAARRRRATVEFFFAELSRGDISSAFSVVSDEVSWWFPGELSFSGVGTKAEIIRIVAAIQAGFPEGFSLAVRSMIVIGDEVAAEVEARGVHYSGRRYDDEYNFMIRFDGEKFIEVHEQAYGSPGFRLIRP